MAVKAIAICLTAKVIVTGSMLLDTFRWVLV